MSECNNCGGSGFVYNPNTQKCEKEETVPAVYTGQTLPLVNVTSGSFSTQGLRVHEDITNFTYPIVGEYTAPVQVGQPLPPYEIKDANGNVVNNVVSSVKNNLWGNTQLGCGNASLQGGRLNATSVWSANAASIPNNTPICFEFCIDIAGGNAVQKTIGIAGDNEVVITIDNQEIIRLTGGPVQSGGGGDEPIKRWHVFPFTFTPGNHTIKLCGLNYGSSAAFGAEIYDLTSAELITNFTDPINNSGFPINCGNQPGEIIPYLLFSTANLQGTSVPDPSTPGTWSCPSNDYTLDICNGTPECVRTVQANVIPCCYTVRDCETGTDYKVNLLPQCLDPSVPPVTFNIGEIWKLDYISDFNPKCPTGPLDEDKCYEIISFENPCTETVVCSYCPIQKFANCECKPCYACTNCVDSTDRMYFRLDEATLNTDKTYVFSFDDTKCWNCELVEDTCLPPVTNNTTISECSGDPFKVEDYLGALVQASGNYTYQIYIDPTHDTLWTESTQSWTPTGLPNGFAGAVQTLYVLAFIEGCPIPGEAVLSLEWESLDTCHACTVPALISNSDAVCETPGFTTYYDLLAVQATLALSNHPNYNDFVYTWYTDIGLSIPVSSPSAALLNPGNNIFYLKAEYDGCQSIWMSSIAYNVELLDQLHPNCGA